jgi:hypothetical protein
VNSLKLSAHQVWEASRILDRHGSARASLDGSTLVMFIGEDDAPAELLVRLGSGGEVLLAQRLSRPVPEEPEPDDGASSRTSPRRRRWRRPTASC